MSQIAERIKELKEKNNVLILAHYYQPDDVQDIADMVGDSYGLAKKSADTDADYIMFCGVKFMAESAKILNPDKTVILPAMDAGCPMADMVDAARVKHLREEYPDAAFVGYVNTSAEVKAEIDVCCTSSNAVNVVKSLPEKQIVFLPDANLASFVAKQVDKEIIAYNGYCIVHKRVSSDSILAVKREHPDVPFLVHPECTKEVVELADFVGSTAQIIKYATESPEKKFIIGTEEGILHQLKKDNPNKEFIIASNQFVCVNMKKNSTDQVLAALEAIDAGSPINTITLSDDIIKRAKRSLDRMLEIGG
ncbi:MAG: quinolinate synthase NadA [Eubacteriales bacterium]